MAIDHTKGSNLFTLFLKFCNSPLEASEKLIDFLLINIVQSE